MFKFFPKCLLKGKLFLSNKGHGGALDYLPELSWRKSTTWRQYIDLRPKLFAREL